MTTAEDRLAEVRENYHYAIVAYETRFDDATADQRKRLRKAYDDAETAYNDAIADGLEQNSADIEAAYKSLVSANDATRDSLKQLEAVGKILNKLEKAIKLATKLVGLVALVA